MITAKRFWSVFIVVAAFTGAYLFYVKKDREASIRQYITQPQIGDIYKMRRETRQDGVMVFYLKIKDIGQESIYFYPSRLINGALHDSFLKQFDTTETEVFTKKELAAIAAGQWNNAAKDKTVLVEIERK
ncbi:MAG TPA: hypothetical protein VL307_16360 [Chitinophagaceae bacterium]|nr:hypothetical protein [Chitinophagaceae bacterium]